MVRPTLFSGGQTGVDRAALDSAAAAGVPNGGWCPAGGWAEDLPEPPGLLAAYPTLRPTGSRDPAERTRRNVAAADGVLVLRPPALPSAGTDLTVREARRTATPCLVLDPTDTGAAARATAWVRGLGPSPVVDVAGPRESEWPGAYAAARALLDRVLADAAESYRDG